MTRRCHFIVYSIKEKSMLYVRVFGVEKRSLLISQNLLVGPMFFYNNTFVYLSTISYHSTPKNYNNHANVQHLKIKGINLLRKTVT